MYWIRSACNGLLLVESTLKIELDFLDYVNSNIYYVLDPTTRKSENINLPRTHDINPYVGNLTLAFDPCKSPYYKIVCVTADDTGDSRNKPSPTYWIHVYDSEFHEWELKLGPFAHPHDESLFRCHGEPWNDAVYLSISIAELPIEIWEDIVSRVGRGEFTVREKFRVFRVCRAWRELLTPMISEEVAFVRAVHSCNQITFPRSSVIPVSSINLCRLSTKRGHSTSIPEMSYPGKVI